MKNSFNVSVSVDETTGRLLSVYFRIRKGKVDNTKEAEDGAAYADYDRKGNLLGIEVIAPCSFSVLDSIAPSEPAKNFIRNSMPKHMELVGA